MADALEIAIEAREVARAQKDRLDRMNGSIDGLRTEVARANATGQEILRRLDRQDGVQQGASSVKASLLDSKRWVVGLAISCVGSGTFVALATYFLRS